MELSIDTSTDWGGIAISHEGQLLAEITWMPGQNHSSELHPNLNRLLAIAQSRFDMLTAIFVATGPGSFNGLRAGISTAKGIAFSNHIPIIGISTLEVEAYQFEGLGLPLCPVHDAGRGEIAVALYSSENGWHCLKEAHLTTVEQLCLATTRKTIFCGELPEAATDKFHEVLGKLAVIPGFSQRLRRPASLAKLGWWRLQSGEPSDLVTLQPIYLRQPPITQRKKKY